MNTSSLYHVISTINIHELNGQELSTVQEFQVARAARAFNLGAKLNMGSLC